MKQATCLYSYCAILLVTLFSLEAPASENAKKTIDYTEYGELLSQYVDEQGMVNYKGLKADGDKLNRFLESMNAVSEAEFQQWSRADQIAYWVNAYNVFTLKAIVDHYPIKAGWIASLRFPKNSIRQISGVWDDLTFGAMGKPITLSDIEHKVLRVKYDEPRIHAAIVCASIGCPPLLNEPFTGERLEEQLTDQSKKFLANPQNFRIDQDGGYVYLSSIFSWFGEDFVSRYGSDERFTHLGEDERAVMNFISQYVSEEEKAVLENNKLYVSYNSYDWSLNEQS